MYSVTELESFVVAQEALKSLTAFHSEKDLKDIGMADDKSLVQQDALVSTTPLIYLIGTKSDLSHYR